MYGSLRPRSFTTLIRPLWPTAPPTSSLPSSRRGKSTCGLSAQTFRSPWLATATRVPMGPPPFTVTVTDSLSPFIITPRKAVAVISRPMAAVHTGVEACTSAARWHMAVVSHIMTRACPPIRLRRSISSPLRLSIICVISSLMPGYSRGSSAGSNRLMAAMCQRCSPSRGGSIRPLPNTITRSKPAFCKSAVRLCMVWARCFCSSSMRR